MTKITLATIFTLLRIVLSPLLVVCMVKGWWQTAFLIFISASLSDAADGFFARLRNEHTVLGACLDPVADKIFLISCFFTLAYVETLLVPYWFVYLVILKEAMLLVGVLLLYLYVGHVEIKPTWISKCTTSLQIFFIGWLFFCYFFGWTPTSYSYNGILGMVTVMIIVSLVQYAYIGFFKLGNA